jgi:hypothetical protein
MTPRDHQPQNTNTTDTQANNWMQHANCKNQTHQMFPQHHKDATYIEPARKICRQCTVKEPCLNYALEFPPADMHGVWAGLTPRQLAAEQRARGIKAIRPTLAAMWGDKQ